MHKKIFIILLIIILVVIAIITRNYFKEKSRQNFLSRLKGQIVFTKRNKDGIADIWKINANGTGAVMLYHNQDKVNSNSLYPEWSADGLKIYFNAMKDGKWRVFKMDANGKNVKVAENPVGYHNREGVSWLSRESSIIVKKGSVYYRNKNGQEIKVYNHRFYGTKFNIGAEEASWGPHKEYIIFQADGHIIIADKNGKSVKLTSGSDPDWKGAE